MTSEQPAAAVRVQKALAAAGWGSRRACEQLIAAGRVTVNGQVASLGDRVDVAVDVVGVDGERVALGTHLVHAAMNKPVGMVSAMTSPQGRPCVGDKVRELGPGVHHVGRLDVDSEGLLLVMNDGELSHRLTHPRYEVPKRYLVELAAVVPRALGRQLRAGVELDDGPARVSDFRLVQAATRRSLVEVTIHEGRNRIVRRMFEAAGFPVERLVRTEVGPIRLGELPPGRLRRLSPAEVRALYKAVGL